MTDLTKASILESYYFKNKTKKKYSLIIYAATIVQKKMILKDTRKDFINKHEKFMSHYEFFENNWYEFIKTKIPPFHIKKPKEKSGFYERLKKILIKHKKEIYTTFKRILKENV